MKGKPLFNWLKYPTTLLLLIGMLLPGIAPLVQTQAPISFSFSGEQQVKHIDADQHSKANLGYAELLEVEVDDENDEHLFELNYTHAQVRLMAKHDGYSCNQLLLTLNKKCRSAVSLPLYVWHQSWKNFPDLV